MPKGQRYSKWIILTFTFHGNSSQTIQIQDLPRKQSRALLHVKSAINLFALGIVLIELSLKQKLSNRRLPEDFQPNEAMTDFNTATRLVNEVYDESGSRYGGVVQRCLTCPFNLRDLRNFSLDNKEFQEAVFDHILTPLRQDYEDFNGFQRIR